MLALTCLAIAAVVATPTTSATTVSLELALPSAAPATVMVRATPLGGREPQRATPVEAPVPLPGTAALTLAREIAWRFELVSQAWWAAPVTTYLAKESAVVTLRAWPASFITGRLKPPEREAMPPTVKVRFRAPAEPKRVSARVVRLDMEVEPHGEFECPVKEGGFRCLVPATLLDLRLRCQGYVSFFRWRQSLAPGAPLDLGELRLVPGASVVGRVTTAEGPADPTTCRVKLRPQAAGRPEGVEETGRWASKAQQTGVDRHGFFGFEGLEPGVYVLEATQPGFVAASTGRFTVLERAESELREALVLQRPVRLRVTVVPPLTPSGQPWGLVVLRRDLVPGHFEIVFNETMGEDGTMVTGDLAPGPVVVTIYETPRSRVLQQEHELSADAAELVLSVPRIEVTGRALLGRKPLEAEVWFGRRTGDVVVRMLSDQDGEFHGFLPREGKWAVQVLSEEPTVDKVLRNVDVKADPDTRRAEVELRLPDAGLRGTVVDERGAGVAGASVLAVDEASDALGQTASKHDGGFEFRGVTPGPYLVSAEDMTGDGPRQSAGQLVVVPASGDPPPVRLVLLRKRQLEGIVHSDGRPVAGARVSVWANWRDPAPAWEEEAMTDSAGRFRVLLGASARELLVYVMAPGFAFKAFAPDLAGARTLTLDVTALGGELDIQLPQVIEHRESDKPKWVAWQDGLPIYPDTLVQWSAVAGQPQPWASAHPTWSGLSPGNYRVCLFADFAEAVSALQTRPRDERSCARGFLPPAGALTLDLRGVKLQP